MSMHWIRYAHSPDGEGYEEFWENEGRAMAACDPDSQPGRDEVRVLETLTSPCPLCAAPLISGHIVQTASGIHHWGASQGCLCGGVSMGAGSAPTHRAG